MGYGWDVLAVGAHSRGVSRCFIWESEEGGQQATAAECLQEEVDAFRLEASWWYDRYGRYGKSSPNSEERSMNNIMWAWFNDELREFVLLSESYQGQCLGGVVE